MTLARDIANGVGMKSINIDDLGLFSGSPLFKEVLHVGRPNVGHRENFIRRVNELFDRRWFSNNGPFVQEFEEQLRRYLQVKHCIPICNGTVALEIAIRALNLKGEVLVPSFTFIATPHALQWQEITPVFCDLDLNTHCLDVSKLEKMLTPKTTGILGVHIWGRPFLVEPLTEFANKYGLALLFDAAHAFGVSHKGRMIGNFGAAEVFSFHATKFFNTFEGGAIATNDDDLARKIRLMKNFGFAGADKVIYPGTNGKMTEISAAMGLSSLECIEEVIETNRRNYHCYEDELQGVPGLKLVTYDESERNNYQYIIVEVDEQRAGINRDTLVSILHKDNVLARRYFYPGCHEMEPYQSHFPHASLLVPKTEQLCARVMSLPNGTAVSRDDIKKICAIIRLCVERADAITDRCRNLTI